METRETFTVLGGVYTIDNGVITNAKLATMAALSVKVNATNATAAPTDLAASADNTVLLRSGTAIIWSLITTSNLTDAAVTYQKFQNISATQKVLGRNSAGAGPTEELSASQILDWLSATQGAVIYRGASGWAALAPGTAGQVLQTNGASANPTWATVSGGGSLSGLTATNVPVATSATAIAPSGSTSATGIFFKNTTNFMGVNQNNPQYSLDVSGTIHSDGSINADGSLNTNAFLNQDGVYAQGTGTANYFTYYNNWNNLGSFEFKGKDATLSLFKLVGSGTGSVIFPTLTGTGNRLMSLDASGTAVRTSIDPANISGTNTGDQTITLTGPVTGSGTGSFATTITDAAVTLAKMANLGNQLLIGRNSAGTGVPEALSASQVLDWISATQGSILYRNATGWVALAPGTDGNVLTTHSTGANPTWTAVSGGSGFSNPMTTLGDIIYGGASGAATRLAGNTTTTPKILMSTGASSAATAPTWSDGSTAFILNQIGFSQTASIWISGNVKTDGGIISGNTTITNGGGFTYIISNGNTTSGIKFWVNSGGDLAALFGGDKKIQFPGSVTSGTSSDVTGMTEGSTLSVKGDNSATTGTGSTFRFNQTVATSGVVIGSLNYAKASQASGTVADLRAFASIIDQGSANPITAATAGRFGFLLTATSGGTITTYKGIEIAPGANTSTAATISTYYGVFNDAPFGAGTLTITNRYAFYNNDANATNYLKGPMFLPSLGTSTADKLSGHVNSSGEQVVISIGSGLSLSGNTLSATGAGAGSLAVINDADYTVATGVTHVLYKTMTATRTLTLPAASSSTNRVITVGNGGGGAFSITTSASMRENGSTTSTSIPQNHYYTLMSDGTEWWIVQKF
jgi:hypothetical protein